MADGYLGMLMHARMQDINYIVTYHSYYRGYAGGMSFSKYHRYLKLSVSAILSVSIIIR